MVVLAWILVFSLHLIAAGVATVAPFVCLWLEWRESSRGDTLAGTWGRRLGWHALFALVLAILFGAISLYLLCQIYPRPYLEAVFRMPGHGVWLGLPERIWSTIAELVIYALSMLGFLWTFNLWRDREGGMRVFGRVINRGLALFAGTNLFYHLPLLFAVVAVLATRPEMWGESRTFIQLMSEPEVIARATHAWLASIAITGVMLMTYSLPRGKLQPEGEAQSSGESQHDRAAIWGARIAAVPVLLQLLVGVFLLFQVPARAREQLLGGDWRSGAIFGLAVFASVGLLHLLTTPAFGDTDCRTTWKSIAALAVVIVSMVAVHHFIRDDLFHRLDPSLVHGPVSAPAWTSRSP